MLGWAKCEECLNLYERIVADHNPLVLQATKWIYNALRTYGPESCYVSFNGGKDGTIVLELYCSVLAFYYKTCNLEAELQSKPRAVFFQSADEFPCVLSFVQETRALRDLDLSIYDGSYKEKLRIFLLDINARASKHSEIPRWNPHPLLIIGVRKGDPNTDSLLPFQPFSEWLPTSPFMRLHPILDWTYGNVWDFIRQHSLPYCSLYKDGYTSLGCHGITRRNSVLKVGDAYREAWQLEEAHWESEREGRTPNSPD